MKDLLNIFNKQYYLTDGGMETTLVYHQGIELNHFAAFELLNTDDGRKILLDYYQTYVDIAAKRGIDFILETPTWRAHSDWAPVLGYSTAQLSEINQHSVYFLRQFIEQQSYPSDRFLISGCLGPRGDGYIPGTMMSTTAAKEYHRAQIQDFAYADVDVVTAMTINYSQEASGIVMAAQQFGVPVVISFTVETNGILPSGEKLSEAIQRVDVQTDGYAQHYMINCAHPSHFAPVLEQAEGDWINRIQGIRANASCKSHEELDNSETLDTGNIYELAEGYLKLRELLPNLKVIGGCCGTDHSHLNQISEVLFTEPSSITN
ncbi:MAG: homocysteine S-methyltransferase [Cyclobacteriaceae bacterium]|nr:MAG: homocysteine S-methyltransferase [Cyclobacteriaceae bacterium]